MRTSRLRAVIVTLWAAAAAEGSDVFVHVGETQGQGSARRYGDACLIMTPHHVGVEPLQSPGAPSRLTVVGPDRSRYQAFVSKRYPELDLAILQLETEAPPAVCPRGDWPDGRHLESLLSKTSLGELKFRRPDGGASQIPVHVDALEGDHLWITPMRESDQIVQGMSGGTLVLEGEIAGVLITVDPSSRGRVLRQDRLRALIAGDFPLTYSAEIRRAFRENLERENDLGAGSVQLWRGFLDRYASLPSLGEEDQHLLAGVEDRLAIWKEIAGDGDDSETLRLASEAFLELVETREMEGAYSFFTETYQNLEPLRDFRVRMRAYLHGRGVPTRPRTCVAHPPQRFAFGVRSVLCTVHISAGTVFEELHWRRQENGFWKIETFSINEGEVYE